METTLSFKPLAKLMTVSMFTAGLLLTASGLSWADRDGRQGWQGNRIEQRHDQRKWDRNDHRYQDRDYRDRKVTVIRDLPRGYRTVTVNKARYYVHDHRYYTRGQGGYVVVRPPVGAFFATLPFGAFSITIDGGSYFQAGDAYYRPASRGYVVVDPPRRNHYSGGSIVVGRSGLDRW
jgi:hypothetical protein